MLGPKSIYLFNVHFVLILISMCSIQCHSHTLLYPPDIFFESILCNFFHYL